MTFAHGAIRAAIWLAGKSPGLYPVEEALGLHA
jgi:dihydrodipicolinate reductase